MLDILKTLNPADKQWDKWGAFHWGVGPRLTYGENALTVFDTGEAVLTALGYNPDQRKHIREAGIEIATTADSKHTFYLPDGTRCVTAWLNQKGQQEVVIDHDRNRVHRLSREAIQTHPHVPTRLADRFVCWYSPGPGKDPVGGELSVSRPLRDYPYKDYLAHLRKLADTVKMAAELSGTVHGITGKARAFEQYADAQTIDDLTESDKFMLVNDRYQRWEYKVPFLKVDPSRA